MSTPLAQNVCTSETKTSETPTPGECKMAHSKNNEMTLLSNELDHVSPVRDSA